jgi:hypothetical protein
LLIIRVDQRAASYNLAQGQEFQVNIQDDERFFRQVSFKQQNNGSMLLELESVSGPGGGQSSSKISIVDPPTNSSGCPGARPQRVRVGKQVRVCTREDHLILRQDPRLGGLEIIRVDPGTQLAVLAGPSCADNSSWWKVKIISGSITGLTGWVREGSDEKDPYFICP